VVDEEFKRPSPEALLKLAQKEEAQKVRGRLTIYFGAAPGVGKTYAMLADARIRRLDGQDIIVGYAETHGRAETEALLEGLEVVDPLYLEYKGMQLREVNLEQIIKRKPGIVLVDELAHTNAPGSRHTKRHQDVEELLNAGIDVYTTLNVQHLESLNDIVYQIIGIRVRETVPDTVIQAADEIKLIDLPPDELRKRLHEGKVYVTGIVGIAVENFFRPGNLLALREIALRLVADSVDKRMLQYMEAHAIAGLWPVHERVMVGIFASPYAEALVRSAFRLASELHAEWIAFHVETEKNGRFSGEEKQWLNKALDLAKNLGGRVVWIKGADEAEEIAIYAQNHNVTKIIIGKPRHFGLFPTLWQRILTQTPNIDIYLLDAKTDFQLRRRKRQTFAWAWAPPANYALSLLAVALVSLIAFLLRDQLGQVNLLTLFLLPVIGSALYLGRGASICATLVSILVFDYLFVPPYFSFAVADLQYFLSFVVYATVAVLISNLASGLRNKVELLRQSEARSTAWDGLSRDLVIATHVDQVLNMLVRHTRQIFPGEIAIFLAEEGQLKVKAKTPGFEINPKALGVASWVFLNKLPAGRGTSTLPEAKALYLPLMASGNAMGVLGFRAEADDTVMSSENQVVLDTIARLGAMALERIGSQP
jgi:two-component system sensor histidine kinase KdpD